MIFLVRFCLFLLYVLIFAVGLGMISEIESHISNSSELILDSLHYVIFTQDLNVDYVISRSDDVQLEVISSSDQTILSTIHLPSNTTQGRITLPCGSLESSDLIYFRLVRKDSGMVLTSSDKVNVTWPQMNINTIGGRNRFTALSENIVVDVSVENRDLIRCHSNSSTDYSLSLEFYGSGRNGPELLSRNRRSSHTLFIPRLFERKDASMAFSCRYVDQAGVYRVVLRAPSHHRPTAVIATSDFLQVDWNTEYELRSTEMTIMPCNDDFNLYFSRPRCAGNEDRIRLFRQLRKDDFTDASQTKLSYVAERRVRKSANHVTFPCDLFEDSSSGYCWKYISTARSRAVNEQTSFCLPTTSNDRITDGDWSAWSEWSDCSATCSAGTTIRFRSCDNPSPANGGTFCSGHMTQSKACHVSCPDLMLLTTVNYNVIAVNSNSSCDCGCEMKDREGLIISSSACIISTAIWTIIVNENETIKLSFIFFKIDNEDGVTNLRVRDGESTMSTLLLNTYDGVTTSAPKDLYSTGSVMMVEFRAPVNYSGGFIAKYSTQVKNTSTSAVEIIIEPLKVFETPLWRTVVIIVGVVVCIVVIISAIVIICHDSRCCCCRRSKEKKRRPRVLFQLEEGKDNDRKKQDDDKKRNNRGVAVVKSHVGRETLDEITPLKFLATSSPYMDTNRSSHKSNSRKKRKPKTTTSDRHHVTRNEEIDLTSNTVAQEDPISFIKPHLSGSRKKSRRKDHEKKSFYPPPSSTFEEDLRMLTRQNDVLQQQGGGGGGGGQESNAATALNMNPTLNVYERGQLSATASPVVYRNSDKGRRHENTFGVIAENVPSKYFTEKSRKQLWSPNRIDTPPSGQWLKSTALVVGQRPPVEGSYDLAAAVTKQMNLLPTDKHDGVICSQAIKTDEGFNDAKREKSLRGNKPVTTRKRLDFDQPAESNEKRYKTSPILYSQRKEGSVSKTKNNPELLYSVDGQDIEEFLLRSDYGPDGQSQRALKGTTSHSMNKSYSPSFLPQRHSPTVLNSFRPLLHVDDNRLQSTSNCQKSTVPSPPPSPPPPPPPPPPSHDLDSAGHMNRRLNGDDESSLTCDDYDSKTARKDSIDLLIVESNTVHRLEERIEELEDDKSIDPHTYNPTE